MIELIFDSNSLITACKCHYQKSPVLDYFLANCVITVPRAVEIEVVDVGSMYADALFAESLIDMGKIKVENVSQTPSDILMHYKLGVGEREAIMLSLQMKGKADFLVTDDRLAFVIRDRLGIAKILFLDLIVEFVKKNLMDSNLAQAIVHAVKSRYQEEFLYHTLKILETESPNGKG